MKDNMTEKTKHQVARFFDKVADKYPLVEEPILFTDIHVRLSQETGDVMAYDDDGKEITRCVVEEWIGNADASEAFWQSATAVMQAALKAREPHLGIQKPYSFILETENGEHVAELYVVDDSETVIISAPLMEDMDKDLDDFIDKLLSE